MEDYQSYIRFASFLGAFAVFAVLETIFSDRQRKLKRLDRWPNAFGLIFVSGVFAKLMLPVGLAVVAIWANENAIGIFNVFHFGNDWLVYIVCFFLFDLAIWGQHYLTHKIDFLWRLHRVHHTDPDVDVTTAFRFHPVEICLSLLWKISCVLMLGAPAEVVFWSQVVLNVSAQFNHANIKLNSTVDAWLRWIIVTPDMHRVHHSVDQRESDTNYGFFLSVWDRLFGFYTHDFAAGENAVIGQEGFQEKSQQRLDKLLIQPLKSVD